MNLQEKLKLLSAASKEKAAASPKDCALFLGTSEDKEYIPQLKGMFGDLPTFVCLDQISLLTHLELYCASRNITKIVSTNTAILSKLIPANSSPSLDNYAGSLFTHKNLEIVFVSPLKQIFTVPYGRFLAQRFISKLTSPASWIEPAPFNWTLLEPSKYQAALDDLSYAYAIAVDIETTRKNLAIRCIAYAGIFISPAGTVKVRTYVLPLISEYEVVWMRKLNSLPAAKIFQNGKYDNIYFLRFNAPVTNWLWDTAHLQHCIYSELPKDLAFINAFYLRSVVYWKDMADTQDLQEYYRYNAMDAWATANVWMLQMLKLPAYAKKNYILEFPLVFPCLLAESTGIIRDMDRLASARSEVDTKESAALSSLRACLGAANFNPGSPVQVKTLLKILGCSDITSSNEKDINKARLRHPLNGFLLDKILDIRGLRKLRSTYLRTADDEKSNGEGGAKELKGTILYALNPHGTDSGRLASRESAFWCGLQIQNIPRGKEVKQTLRAADGFYLGECDLEQAESRDTANISGDERLIEAVSGKKDFHSVNASSFFGVPYESIYSDAQGKTLDKPLRDLAKRVNHGANYNMGPGVLVDTMGLDKIWQAAKLLSLTYTDPLKIASHLLESFHRTYASLRKNFYPHIIHEVATTRKITSRAFHHTPYNLSAFSAKEYISEGDWTRYCFGDPSKSKPVLNSYISHPPQSLNARTLNEAFMQVFYEVALPNPTTFRLHAQIHDSILFSYAHGHEHHAERVKELMEIPVTVKDVSGNYRTFTVPAALKIGPPGKPSVYWSETE